MPSDPRVSYGTAVILYRSADESIEVCLIRRKGSHGAGLWACPGGWVDFGERSVDAAKRELKEELGVVASHMTYLCHSEEIFANTQSLSLYFTAAIAKDQEPCIMEPEKCSEIQWFDLWDLTTGPPRDDLFAGLRHGLQEFVGTF